MPKWVHLIILLLKTIMSEQFKQRIFIKDGKISHYLERGEYPDDETLNMI